MLLDSAWSSLISMPQLPPEWREGKGSPCSPNCTGARLNSWHLEQPGLEFLHRFVVALHGCEANLAHTRCWLWALRCSTYEIKLSCSKGPEEKAEHLDPQEDSSSSLWLCWLLNGHVLTAVLYLFCISKSQRLKPEKITWRKLFSSTYSGERQSLHPAGILPVQE